MPAQQAQAGVAAVPGDQKRTDDWSAEAELAVVIETVPLSEIELSEYCRSKGLYPQQVKAWHQACLLGQQSAQGQQRQEREQAKADKKRIKELERELKRKDKALAGAAAILVLRKKRTAYWGDDSEES